jgi:hypothetical protein
LKEGTAVAALGDAASGVRAESERSWTEEAFSSPPAGVLPQESDSGEPGTSAYTSSLTMVFHPENGSWSSSSSNGGSAFSNEALAVQLTENRLKVLALERRMQLVERALALVQDRLAPGGQVQ